MAFLRRLGWRRRCLTKDQARALIDQAMGATHGREARRRTRDVIHDAVLWLALILAIGWVGHGIGAAADELHVSAGRLRRRGSGGLTRGGSMTADELRLAMIGNTLGALSVDQVQARVLADLVEARDGPWGVGNSADSTPFRLKASSGVLHMFGPVAARPD